MSLLYFRLHHAYGPSRGGMLIDDPDMLAAIDGAVQQIRAGDLSNAQGISYEDARYGGLANARLREPCGYNVAGTGSNTVAHPAEACEIVVAGEAFRTQFGDRRPVVFRYRYTGGRTLFEVRLCWEDSVFHENIIVAVPREEGSAEQEVLRKFVTRAPLDLAALTPEDIRSASWSAIAP